MSQSRSINIMTSSKVAVATLALVALVVLASVDSSEAKLLRKSRYYDDFGSNYDSPYASASGVPTGERAILTVRGTRNPYDGSAPSKITIEDQPHRGPYPRGVYDRLDGGYPSMGGAYPMGGGRYPMMMNRPDPYSSGYGPYSGGYNGYGGYGAPSRIAVTGAFPYGYGSRRYL